MSFRAAVCLSSLILAHTACGGDKEPDDTHDSQSQEVVVERADCDEAVGGIPWGDGAPYEAQEGVANEIGAMDLNELPETIDISDFGAFYRGYIAYTLDVPPGELGATLPRDAVLDMGHMGIVVLASIYSAGADGSGFDFIFFRRAFHRFYTCSRTPPLLLEDFQAAVYDFESLDYNDVDSIAKCGTRRLYADHENGVYVAQTIEDSAVRETEILLSSDRSDGNLDFLVYHSNGHLTDRTQFPTISGGDPVVTSAPYACMSCHFDATQYEDAWTFDVLLPESGPCAR